MPNTRKGEKIDLYNSHFAATLRDLMEKRNVTQKELATAVGVRPQTLSLYCTGETQPNVDKLLKIAEYFETTTDFLITGTVLEDIPVRETLGLSERTVENMKLVKDGYFEDNPEMLSMLDYILGDKDFYFTLQAAGAEVRKKANGPAEMQEFHEWKATQAMQDYFLNFFTRHYDERKND